MTMKKKMKNNNKNLISHLQYNRCQIKLDEIESIFLSKNIDFDDINYQNIKNSIQKLYEMSDVRYFSQDKIEPISTNLYKSLKKKLNEEVGRNYQTVFKKGYGNIQHDNKIEIKSNVSSIDQTIDTNDGKYVVKFKINNKLITKKFNSEAESELFVQTLSFKTS